MKMMNIVLSLLLIIAALNWLVTGIRSLSDGSSKDVPDLLNLLGIHQIISNIVYIIIGLVGVYTVYEFVV